MQNRFLWGGSLERDVIHWIRWDLVKTPMSRGGLGVADIRIVNSSLLGKWVWRFAVERNAWWRSLMVKKCGVGVSEWQPYWNFQSAGLSIWRWIVKESSIFWKYGLLDPGGGNNVSFWHDVWFESRSLASRFPRIKAASQFMNCLNDAFSWRGNEIVWCIRLRGQLRGGALDEWESFVNYLNNIPIGTISVGPAFVIWPFASNGLFTVKSFGHELRRTTFVGIRNFPASFIWNKMVPSKIQCFTWQVFHGKIATMDNLQRKARLFGMLLVPK
ncbi:Putative ribonuclease H protein At1g65750 [Linum grandiflorum]